MAQVVEATRVGRQIEIKYKTGKKEFVPFRRSVLCSLTKQALLYHKKMYEHHKEMCDICEKQFAREV